LRENRPVGGCGSAEPIRKSRMRGCVSYWGIGRIGELGVSQQFLTAEKGGVRERMEGTLPWEHVEACARIADSSDSIQRRRAYKSGTMFAMKSPHFAPPDANSLDKLRTGWIVSRLR